MPQVVEGGDALFVRDPQIPKFGHHAGMFFQFAAFLPQGQNLVQIICPQARNRHGNPQHLLLGDRTSSGLDFDAIGLGDCRINLLQQPIFVNIGVKIMLGHRIAFRWTAFLDGRIMRFVARAQASRPVVPRFSQPKGRSISHLSHGTTDWSGGSWLGALARTAVVLVAAAVAMTAAAQEVPITRIAQIYGMAADPSGEALLYLATERGFFVVGPSGLAQQLSPGTQKFTGFAANPRESGTFFAAGDATGGPADTLLMSQDFGRSWQAVGAPIPPPAFLALDYFAGDPNKMAGASDALYQTSDGGLTWTAAVALPGQPIDRSAQTLFVGTTSGLFVTEDGGQSWLLALAEGRPASMVASVGDGRVFAFVIGQGLFVGGNAGQPWDLVAPATAFEGALLHLAGNFAGTLFAVTQFMKLLVSDDGGGTWTAFTP